MKTDIVKTKQSNNELGCNSNRLGWRPEVKWYYGILAYPPAPNFQKCSFLLEIHTMKIDIQTR